MKITLDHVDETEVAPPSRARSGCSWIFLWLVVGLSLGAAGRAVQVARGLERRIEVLEELRRADLRLELERLLKPAEAVRVPETHPFGCDRSPLAHARADCDRWELVQ